MTGWGLVFGAAMLLPLALATGDIPVEIHRMRAFDVATILYIGLCGTVLAFAFWSRGPRTIGPARVSIVLNLVPIWGAILEAWPSPTTLSAMLLAIARGDHAALHGLTLASCFRVGSRVRARLRPPTPLEARARRARPHRAAVCV